MRLASVLPLTPAERRTGPVFAFPGGRRSFATRWAFRLPPLALQAIMRHSSMQTTLGYYVDLSSTAADVAKLLAGQ